MTQPCGKEGTSLICGFTTGPCAVLVALPCHHGASSVQFLEIKHGTPTSTITKVCNLWTAQRQQKNIGNGEKIMKLFSIFISEVEVMTDSYLPFCE